MSFKNEQEAFDSVENVFKELKNSTSKTDSWKPSSADNFEDDEDFESEDTSFEDRDEDQAEDTEDYSEDDQDEEGEESQEDDSQKEDPAKESRAQKRIRQLVEQRKRAEEEKEELRKALEQIKREKETSAYALLEERRKQAETQKKVLEDGLKGLSQAWAAAVDEGDSTKAADINLRIQKALLLQNEIEKSLEEMTSKPKVEDQPYQEAPRPPKEAVRWAAANDSWLNKDTGLTAAARLICDELIAEGFDPMTKEYYNELDERLMEFKPKRPSQKNFADAARRKKQQPVSGGSRTPASAAKRSNSHNLSQEELEMAEMLGLTPEAYAKAKTR